MSNKRSSFPLSNPPPAHGFGGRVAAQSELAILLTTGDTFLVMGSGTVNRLPNFQSSPPILLRVNDAPTFVHSANLICPGAVNYVAAPGDIVIAVSEGSGVWRIFPILNSGAALVSPSSAWVTGNGRLTLQAAPSSGWIMANDGTIGDASSSAGNRANADTVALFTLLYGFADADAPLLTSVGGATTRGAQGSAAAAYAAHCRVTLTRQLGRSILIAGAGSGLTNRTLGSFSGAETETPTLSKTASHAHDITTYAETAPLSSTYAGTDPQGHGSGYTSFATDSGAAKASGSGAALNILDPKGHWNIEYKL